MFTLSESTSPSLIQSDCSREASSPVERSSWKDCGRRTWKESTARRVRPLVGGTE